MRKEEACPCGQAEDPRARELRSWLTEHRDEHGVALPALQKAQEVYGFLPVEAQRLVAGELGKPLSEIYGIATFYSMFSLTPKGRNHISVCLGTACYVKGGGHIYELLQQKLGRGTSCEVILLEQILYCEVQGRKIYIHKNDGKIVDYYDKLEDMEQRLDRRFFRCHRSYLVNLEYVRGCNAGQVMLSQGDKIPVSRLRERDLTQALLRYMKERDF